MNISTFDDLLLAAKQQPQPQRLLFVFTGADLPQDSTDAQRERYLAGQGGALVPLMYVDKLPQELTTFDQLRQESKAFGKEWSIVFVAALSGIGGKAPSSDAAEKMMQQMVESIKSGSLSTFIPFNQEGEAVHLE